MPRNMSFSLTTQQMRDQSKTVTRRLGWEFLTPGTLVNSCVKCMGLKPGEKVERIGLIRIVKVDREPLSRIRDEPYGPAREGFPGMTHDEFIAHFCKSMNVAHNVMLTRIEFEHLGVPS